MPPQLLRLYPVFLASSALVIHVKSLFQFSGLTITLVLIRVDLPCAFGRTRPKYVSVQPVVVDTYLPELIGLTQWSQLESRKLYSDMSIKYLLNSVPQTLAALLLLYYACTFSRSSSAFTHRMMVHSCLHQSVNGLMLASLMFSAFQASLSLCCTFPAMWYDTFGVALPTWTLMNLCVVMDSPVDPTACQLSRIVACPASVAHLRNYNLCMRAIHSCATITVLFALSSIEAAQTVKGLKAQQRRAKLVTFSRHEPVHEASAAIEM